MRTACALAVALSISAQAWAGEIPAGAAAAVTGVLPPALVVKDEQGKPERLGVTKVTVRARIIGHVAETSATMTFSNPHDRVLEGELYFPLPEGSTVSGYALDIKGVMVDGVVVEKEKGRAVFEKVVRQGVDPGLIEWTKGNNFKTRVYPIPAHGTRTVTVRYVSELAEPAAGELEYRLPVAFDGKVNEASILVEVVRASGEPRFASEKARELGLAFAGKGASFAAEAALKDSEISSELVIRIPCERKPSVIVEKASDGEFYFCLTDYPVRPPVTASAEAQAPRRVAIVWDASGSRGGASRDREFELLRAYFAQDPVRNAAVDVDLCVLRDRMESAKSFKVTGGDVSAVIAALKALSYDGGSQLGAIAPGSAAPDLYIVFTDGISNFGKESPESLAAPAYVVSSGAGANHHFCRYLAVKSGGDYLNLDSVAVEAAVQAIGRSAFSFLKADCAGAADVYPSIPAPVRGRFLMLGRLTAAEANLAASYGAGSAAQAVSSFTVRKADAVEGEALRRAWAQKKVDELAVFPQKNEKEIVETGRRYGLVTPGTSLIVLESPEQYVEHNIVPPATMPEWRAKFEEAVESRRREEATLKTQKLDHILELWKQRVEWWGTSFKYPKNFKYKEPDEKLAMANGGGGARFGYSGAAPAPAGGEDLHDAAPRPAAPSGAHPDATAPAEAMMQERVGETAREQGEGRPARGRTRTDFAGPELALSVTGELAAKKDEADEGEASSEAAIALKPWDPKTPYIEALKAAPAEKRFEVYMAQKKEFGDSPAFFLDCSDFFAAAKEGATALQVLSNVAELELENAALLRILGHRLEQLGELELAAAVFEEVLKIRGEEPQSYRDLALVLAQRAQAAKDPARAKADYARALELLAHVVMNKWDRFDEIEVIALMELNAILPRAKVAGAGTTGLDERLIRLLDADVRIIMTWDADMTDIDLWVIEPSGEKAFYGHTRTTIGGNFSRDFTQGYGPEEYCIRKAMGGVYKIQTNFYGSTAQRLSGAVTVQADVFTNFGRPNEKRRSITLRLKDQKETIDIGQIEF